MSRLVRCGFLLWTFLCLTVAVRADDAEDKAVEFVKKLRGSVTRDEKLPGRPVIRVFLSRTQTGIQDAGRRLLAVSRDDSQRLKSSSRTSLLKPVWMRIRCQRI